MTEQVIEMILAESAAGSVRFALRVGVARLGQAAGAAGSGERRRQLVFCFASC